MQTKDLKSLIVKYKLYHIPFWLGYHLVWLTINIGGLAETYEYFLSDASVKFYFYLVFQTLGVYFNLYYLIPRLLYGGRYWQYILAVLATIFVANAFIVIGYYITALLSERSFLEIFDILPNQYLKVFFVWSLPSTVAIMTLAMSIKLGKNWIESERRRSRLEKENLETELKYLKSQVNPHFLFNTINSIFALIHRNPDLASESLASFSDMLRYQLYECNDAEIALSKELAFLESFIDLEKLRLDESHTEVATTIENLSDENQQIAPLILLPFVENAFKHVSKQKACKNFIRTHIEADEKQLLFKIENSANREGKQSEPIYESSGIGLKNVSRRLDLIYGKRHELRIEESSTFSVRLKITWE